MHKKNGLFGHFYRPNETIAAKAGHIRYVKTQLGKPCSQMVFEKTKEDGVVVMVLKSYFLENGIGKLLTNITEAPFQSVLNKHCEDNFYIEATKLIFALRIYQLENNSLPDSLAQLVPKYIKELPKDPFTGGELKYSKEKKTIYSIGMDGKDEGGYTETTYGWEKDPTVKFNF